MKCRVHRQEKARPVDRHVAPFSQGPLRHASLATTGRGGAFRHDSHLVVTSVTNVTQFEEAIRWPL